MRLLVYDGSAQIRESFMTTLISSGYEVMVLKEKKKILSTIAQKPYSLVILEANESDAEMTQIIQLMSTDSRYENVKIVVHVSNPSKQFVVQMLRFGVVGYLLKPFNEKELLNRLTNILEKAHIDISQRKHVRVKPSESDPVTISFRSLVTHRMIHGVVTDISVGGAAFTIDDGPDHKDDHLEVELRQIINNFHVHIGTTRLSAIVLVTAKKGPSCAILFHQISDFDSNTLCKYIYERLTDSTL